MINMTDSTKRLLFGNLSPNNNLRINILNTYAKYLGHDFQGLTLEKLRIIINEYRTRLFAKELLKRRNLYYLDDEIYQEKTGRRGR